MMDPIGLALEHYDVTGAMRVKDSGNPIDSSGRLYDGTPVTSAADLRAALLKRPTAIARTFTENLMAYALGRRIEPFDMPAVREVARARRGGRPAPLPLHPRDRPAAPRSARRAGRRIPWRTEQHGLRHRQASPAPARSCEASGPPSLCPSSTRSCPAGRPWRRAAAAQSLDDPTRLVCIENVHGAAGSTAYGASRHLWSPAATGRDFDLTPSALSPLEPFRDVLTIVSDTDVRPAEAVTPPEIGGDHFRSSATFLTQSHPKQTESSDVRAGISLDQLYAQRFGQRTPIPSMQLCIENVDQAGGCAYGYSCVYTDTISWASPTEPLPMIRDPRLAFDQLFGAGATPGERAVRRRQQAQRARLHQPGRSPGSPPTLDTADRRRMDRYLTDIREIERRIERVEARNLGGEPRELPQLAAGRSRLVRRARPADVRPAGAGIRDRRHPGLLVQALARRHRARLPRERRHPGLPPRLAPRRARAQHRAVSPS